MDTVFGDGSSQGGGLFGKLLGAGKRLVTGESLFTTVYTNNAPAKQRVAFAAPYPGKILPMDLRQMGGMLICQKDAFLCAARGVSLGIALQQKLSVGFFGGEGFIMQKLEGDGLAFVHAGGTVVKRDCSRPDADGGHRLRGGLHAGVNFEIQYVGKIKTALFGGEGLFFAKITGPGTCGCRACPSRAWRRACSPRRRSRRRARASSRRWAGWWRRPAGRHPGRGTTNDVALRACLARGPSAGCGHATALLLPALWPAAALGGGRAADLRAQFAGRRRQHHRPHDLHRGRACPPARSRTTCTWRPTRRR
jgi:uncharacterized protein (AIM24 family)